MDRFVKLVSASWSSKLSEMERSSYELGKKKKERRLGEAIDSSLLSYWITNNWSNILQINFDSFNSNRRNSENIFLFSFFFLINKIFKSFPTSFQSLKKMHHERRLTTRNVRLLHPPSSCLKNYLLRFYWSFVAAFSSCVISFLSIRKKSCQKNVFWSRTKRESGCPDLTLKPCAVYFDTV